MYKRHKITLFIVFIFSCIILIFFKLNYTNLIAEVISINGIFLTVYTLSLSGLIANSRLCKNLSNEEIEKFSSTSKLGAIIKYYKLGYKSSILSIGFIYSSNLLLKVNLINKFFLELLNCFSFSLLNINFFITIYIINFILNFQLRRFE